MELIKKVLAVLVSATIPILISVITILILLSPLFISLEYQRPGFPEDHYGFTLQERLEFGNLTRRYLISGMTLNDLRKLEFADGGPLYIESELAHLEDVKLVLGGVLQVFYGTCAIFACVAVFAFTGHWKDDFLKAIYLGGKITTGVLVGLLLLTLTSFQSLFTNFHRIFFEGDSWLFNYSDSLIRLFPIRFWQDIFLVFGVLTLAAGILLGWVVPGRERSNRNSRSAS